MAIKYKIKHQLKKIGYENAENNNKIISYVAGYHKINQLFANCLILSRKKSEVCYELEKFSEYVPEPDQVVEELQDYLNEEIIFEFIFHNYLETYNDNIFTAEIIEYLYTQHEDNILNVEDQEETKAYLWFNKDYEELSTRSINFKRLSEINKKYQSISDGLREGYISYISEIEHKQKFKSSSVFKEKEKSDDKFIRLTSILRKIRQNANVGKGKG